MFFYPPLKTLREVDFLTDSAKPVEPLFVLMLYIQSALLFSDVERFSASSQFFMLM